MNKVYFMQLSDDIISEELSNNVIKFIPKEKLRVINSYRNKDRNIKVLSEVFLRCILCSTLKISNDSIKFYTQKYGKPIVKDLDIHFNVSHTKNAIAVAISEKNVGVDLERAKFVDIELKKTLFSIDEQNMFEQNRLDIKLFFEIWTQKEAYVKFLGTGFHTSFLSFSVIDNKINKKFQTVWHNDFVVSSFCSEKLEYVEVCEEDFIDKIKTQNWKSKFQCKSKLGNG